MTFELFDELAICSRQSNQLLYKYEISNLLANCIRSPPQKEIYLRKWKLIVTEQIAVRVIFI